MITVLLSITFGCGVFIAIAHVLNKNFIAPRYDVAANLVAFTCATASSIVLGEYIPAAFAIVAIICWCTLAVRTFHHSSVTDKSS